MKKFLVDGLGVGAGLAGAWKSRAGLAGARRSRAGLVAVMLAAMLLVSGCGGGTGADAGAGGGETASKAEAAYPVTITDDAGREVTLKERPERIVSLAPANTEIVYSLGLMDRLVGVTTFDDYPAEVKDIAKIGDFTTPNLEAIAAAEPDLVLATTGVQADVISKLEELGAVVVALDPASVEAVEDAVRDVGALCGATSKADEVVSAMESDLEALSAKLEGREPVRCFVEIAQEPLFTAGEGTLIGDVVARAGGENVVAEKGYVAYSVEQLMKDAPEVYLVTKGSMSDPKTLSKRPGYSKLTSVREGRVFTLDDNLVSRPGPRIVQGAEQIARALHPDAFEK